MSAAAVGTSAAAHWSAPHVAQLRRCLPVDLRGPCYILSGDEAGKESIDWLAWLGSPAMAFTKLYLDHECRSVLERLGLWNGEGPTVIFPRIDFLDGMLDRMLDSMRKGPTWLDRHEPDVRRVFLETFPGTSDECRLEILLHELAHWFDGEASRQKFRAAGYVPTEKPDAEELLLATLRMIDPNRRPWEQHGASWIRAALHLAHRAERVAPLCFDRLFVAGPAYGLSDVRRYAEALGGELDALESVPVVEILPRAYPAPFARLWQSDTGESLPADDRLIPSPGPLESPRAAGNAEPPGTFDHRSLSPLGVGPMNGQYFAVVTYQEQRSRQIRRERAVGRNYDEARIAADSTADALRRRGCWILSVDLPTRAAGGARPFDGQLSTRAVV